MTQVYFHCSSSRGVRIDQSGEAVSDLAEARDRAACIVRSLIMERGAEDWRDWVVHVSDGCAPGTTKAGLPSTPRRK